MKNLKVLIGGAVLCALAALAGVAYFLPIEVLIISSVLVVAGVMLASTYVLTKQTQRAKTATSNGFRRSSAEAEKVRSEVRLRREELSELQDAVRRVSFALQRIEKNQSETATRAERERAQLTIALTHVVRASHGSLPAVSSKSTETVG
ncbi:MULTISPECIES: hypothetical protein [Cellulosimicrobium]|uniref:hypothetical protein n=1 Tax=Cellulosimicrobium TaxID=157920 RepID=UPI0011A1DA3D|nr:MULTISPECIES: hypothetical protein [Cellulosimicrobium]MBE9937862.1 hypothetical protein [Cellulosimicrobium cellulans]